jgi:plasmid stabilization system protein ParE
VKLEYKPSFFDDLDDISAYITRYFNAGLARDIIRDIDASCKILADNPYGGRTYIRKPYFRVCIVLKKNLVFYHVDEEREAIVLHRVFDGRRDYLDAVDSIQEK